MPEPINPTSAAVSEPAVATPSVDPPAAEPVVAEPVAPAAPPTDADFMQNISTAAASGEPAPTPVEPATPEPATANKSSILDTIGNMFARKKAEEPVVDPAAQAAAPEAATVPQAAPATPAAPAQPTEVELLRQQVQLMQTQATQGQQMAPAQQQQLQQLQLQQQQAAQQQQMQAAYGSLTPQAIVDSMTSENATERKAALDAYGLQIAQTVHANVMQQYQQSAPAQIDAVVQNRIAEQANLAAAERELQQDFPQLFNANVAPFRDTIIAQAVQSVPNASWQNWPLIKQKIGEITAATFGTPQVTPTVPTPQSVGPSSLGANSAARSQQSQPMGPLNDADLMEGIHRNATNPYNPE